MKKNELAKVLFLSGLGLLALLIIIRMVTLKKKEQKIEMKKIEGVQPEDCKIPAKEKRTELLDKLKQEEEKTRTELSGIEYVQLDLRKLLDIPQPDPVLKPNQLAKACPVLKHNSIPKQNTVPMQVPIKDSNLTIKPATELHPVQTTEQLCGVKFGTLKANASEAAGTTDPVRDFFRAEVYGDQKLMNNTSVIVRNLEDMSYIGKAIPKNSLFYGVAAFTGNRVTVLICKVKTVEGEFSVSFRIMDNDRIEGLFYRAPVDEMLANTADNSNPNSNLSTNSVYGSTFNNMARATINSAKDLLQKSRSLNLQEGYALFLIPGKNH